MAETERARKERKDTAHAKLKRRAAEQRPPAKGATLRLRAEEKAGVGAPSS